MEWTVPRLVEISKLAIDLHQRTKAEQEKFNRAMTDTVAKLILDNPPCATEQAKDRRIIKRVRFSEDPVDLQAINCLLTQVKGSVKDDFLRSFLDYGILEKLGQQGVYGVVGKASRQDFIVKSSEDAQDMLMEYSVGYFVTNHYRNEIPNFSGILGMFKCSPPVWDEHSKAQAYCDHDSPYYYLVYEQIQGKTWYHFLETCTLDQFYVIMTGILWTLEYAYQKNKFTHYDLHYHNIIIKEYPQAITINYGPGMILTTKYVPVFIDYGMAYYEYQGKSYGYREYFMQKYDGPHQLHDIFKIVMFTLYRLATDNAVLFDRVKNIAKFFNPSMVSVSDFVIGARDTYYTYPINFPEYKLKPGEKIKITGKQFYQQAFFPVMKTLVMTSNYHRNTGRPYGCRDHCHTLEEALQVIGTRPRDGYINSLTLLDFYRSLGDNDELRQQAETKLNAIQQEIRLLLSKTKRIVPEDNYRYLAQSFIILRRNQDLGETLKILVNWFPEEELPLLLENLYLLLQTNEDIGVFNDSLRKLVPKLNADVKTKITEKNETKRKAMLSERTNKKNFLETVHQLTPF